MPKKKLPSATNAELLIWAVALLGGGQKRVDTEDVAVKAFELSPKRFAWRKYPKQINLELVRVGLSDAKKAEFGRLLTGSGRTGWSLTRNGLALLRAARPRLRKIRTNKQDTRKSTSGSVDSARHDRERKRISSLAAWKRWSLGDRTVVLTEAREVFRLDSYSTPSVRETKMTRLRAMFESDAELDAFLARLSDEIDKQEKTDGASH
jgi:hypothetical protein